MVVSGFREGPWQGQGCAPALPSGRTRGPRPLLGDSQSGGVLTEHRALSLLLAADDIRLFAFVRFTTGDAMSKRSKFALITWIGENVSGLQRAKTGTDKTLVKEVVQVTVLFSWVGGRARSPSGVTHGHHPAG